MQTLHATARLPICVKKPQFLETLKTYIIVVTFSEIISEVVKYGVDTVVVSFVIRGDLTNDWVIYHETHV